MRLMMRRAESSTPVSLSLAYSSKAIFRKVVDFFGMITVMLFRDFAKGSVFTHDTRWLYEIEANKKPARGGLSGVWVCLASRITPAADEGQPGHA